MRFPAASGGYILVRGRTVYDGERYVLIEDSSGEVVHYTYSLSDLQAAARSNSRHFSDEVITPEQYKEIYGVPFDFFYDDCV